MGCAIGTILWGSGALEDIPEAQLYASYMARTNNAANRGIADSSIAFRNIAKWGESPCGVDDTLDLHQPECPQQVYNEFFDESGGLDWPQKPVISDKYSLANFFTCRAPDMKTCPTGVEADASSADDPICILPTDVIPTPTDRNALASFTFNGRLTQRAFDYGAARSSTTWPRSRRNPETLRPCLRSISDLKGGNVRHRRASLGVCVVLVSLAAYCVAASPFDAMSQSPNRQVELTAADTNKEETDTAVPFGFSSWDALAEAQEQLDSTADEIVGASESSGSTGYGSVVVSVGEGSLTLYWKGDLPLKVREVMAAAGSVVRIRPAQYSLVELQEQMSSLTGQAASAGIRLTSVGPTPASDGLDATVDGDVGAARKALVSAVPLEITPGEPVEELASRDHDIAPFWGGASYTTWTGRCSDAFAIYLPGYPVDAPRALLTADHCRSKVDDYVHIGDTAVANGYLAGFEPSLDAAYIQVMAGAKAAPYMYRGGVDSLANSAMKGILGSYVGDWLWTGGAATGEHLTIQVLGVERTYGSKIHMVRAQRMKNTVSGYVPDLDTVAAGHGDSGGPTFMPVVGGTKVMAKGIISMGGGSTFSCPQFGTTCASGVIYEPIGYILKTMPAALAVTP